MCEVWYVRVVSVWYGMVWYVWYGVFCFAMLFYGMVVFSMVVEWPGMVGTGMSGSTVLAPSGLSNLTYGNTPYRVIEWHSKA